MSIRHFAETAKSAKNRAILNRIADDAAAAVEREANMPEWAKACAIDTRVPVSVKVEHDGLEVDTWTSKSGKAMSRVYWADGTTTQYVGDLAKCYVSFDR